MKNKKGRKKPEPEKTKQRRSCFTCNGTGELCGVCGEAVDVCDCEDGPNNHSCKDCFGTGIASADLTEEEKKAANPNKEE
jgi:hypothetical protein